MGFFRVAVSDSGVGLTEDEQNRIFGEFTQFNKNELQSGGVYYLRTYASSLRRSISMSVVVEVAMFV